MISSRHILYRRRIVEVTSIDVEQVTEFQEREYTVY